MTAQSTPDRPERTGVPIPRVLVITEEHTTTDDELLLLARLTRRGRRGPALVTSTGRTRPRGG
ncbi:hypothetical protein ABT081_02435 [Streptomyces sp. NPDC002238]|uniref:hypothetical protein n=1 Tax=Streptomyces sp. NPDC002238 TaxID=3156649 RepID=UPI003332426E